VARLAAQWATLDVDPDLRALGVSLARQVRHETPDAGPMERAAQSLALMVWMKAQTEMASLLDLNRSLGEFVRTYKALGFKSGRKQRPGSPFRPPRVPVVAIGDDEGESE